jgi:hypothetical protein
VTNICHGSPFGFGLYSLHVAQHANPVTTRATVQVTNISHASIFNIVRLLQTVHSTSSPVAAPKWMQSACVVACRLVLAGGTVLTVCGWGRNKVA